MFISLNFLSFILIVKNNNTKFLYPLLNLIWRVTVSVELFTLQIKTPLGKGRIYTCWLKQMIYLFCFQFVSRLYVQSTQSTKTMIFFISQNSAFTDQFVAYLLRVSYSDNAKDHFFSTASEIKFNQIKQLLRKYKAKKGFGACVEFISLMLCIC